MSRQVLYKAPDISVYQGNVNFKELKKNGTKGLFIRAGYGRNNIDQKWVTNIQACYNLGLCVSPYWFSYALNETMAEDEADYCINAVSKYFKRCAIVFDLEYDSINYMRKKGVNPTKKLINDMAVAFLKRVVQRGYVPILYTNRDFIKNWFDIEYIRHNVRVHVELWFACYTNKEPSEVSNGKVIAWQYSSKEKISGINGNVDMNNVYTDIFSPTYNAAVSLPQTTKNINIIDFQNATRLDGLTDQYGKLLEPDGKDGSRTQYVRRRINLRAQKTLISWKAFSTGEVVKWWQQRLNEILGIKLEVDGRFGKATRDATIIFQKRFGLKADGIAGYNSIQMAFYN